MPELVTIGRILKPFGVKGDVRVESLTDVPGRFESLPTVTLTPRSGEAIRATVRRVRKERDSYIIGFDVFCTPEDVGSFRGALIQIPMESLPPTVDGRYYEFQLLGMDVRDETGDMIGTIADIVETAGHPVLVVRQGGQEVLIPGTKHAVLSVDVSERVMVIRGASVMREGDEG